MSSSREQRMNQEVIATVVRNDAARLQQLLAGGWNKDALGPDFNPETDRGQRQAWHARVYGAGHGRPPAATAAYIAAALGHTGILAVLADAGANFSQRGPSGRTLLMAAVLSDEGFRRTGQRTQECVAFLLDHESTDVTEVDKAGKTALDYAQKGSLPEIAELLRSRRGARTSDAWAITSAAKMNQEVIATVVRNDAVRLQQLLAGGWNKDALGPDFNPETDRGQRQAWHARVYGAGHGRPPAATAAYIAAALGHTGILAVLADAGANFSQRGPSGRTLLMAAVLSDEGFRRTGQRTQECVAFLLDHESTDVTEVDKAGKTALDYAQKGSLPEIAELLRSRRGARTSDAWAITSAAKMNQEVIATVVRNDAVRLQQLLAGGWNKDALGPDFNPETDRGQRQAWHARVYGAGHGRPPAATAAYIAAALGHTGILAVLADAGANFSQRGPSGRTLLMAAVLSDEGFRRTGQRTQECVAFLLDHESTDVTEVDKAGKTALDYAQKRSLPEIAELLRSRRGARTSDAWAITSAAKMNQEVIATVVRNDAVRLQQLLAGGWNKDALGPDFNPETDRGQRQAWHARVYGAGHGRPPAATAAYIAAALGHTGILAVLADAGANFSQRGPSGRTLLMAAVLSDEGFRRTGQRTQECVAFLLDHESTDVTEVDKAGKTALDYAQKGSLPEIAALLLNPPAPAPAAAVPTPAHSHPSAEAGAHATGGAEAPRSLPEGVPQDPSVSKLVDMGFSAEQASVALAACNGDPMRAIEHLLAAAPAPPPASVVPDWIIQSSEVELVLGSQGLIGRGALGEVRKGRCRGVDVALKSLHLLRTDEASIQAMGVALSPEERRLVQESFVKECDFLRRACDHPNIVRFVGMVMDAEPLYLATEYCPSGTVHDLLYSHRRAHLREDQGLPLSVQLLVSLGIFQALAFLATIPMIHRDIKPANVLVVDTADGQVEKAMLTDFGEAKQLTQTMTVQTMAGTPVYMAPEMAAEEEAKGPKADVFSAGVVMIEMSVGKVPRPGPEKRREGRGWHYFTEQERRATDLAAVKHPIVADLARRCIVDYDDERADAEAMVAALESI